MYLGVNIGFKALSSLNSQSPSYIYPVYIKYVLKNYICKRRTWVPLLAALGQPLTTQLFPTQTDVSYAVALCYAKLRE